MNMESNEETTPVDETQGADHMEDTHDGSVGASDDQPEESSEESSQDDQPSEGQETSSSVDDVATSETRTEPDPTAPEGELEEGAQVGGAQPTPAAEESQESGDDAE